MTFEILASKVADDFRATMKQEGFGTFKEMADCYWWSSADIREEVDSIIRMIDKSACIDELDGTMVFLGEEMISYRKFSGMWRKVLRSKGRYDD